MAYEGPLKKNDSLDIDGSSYEEIYVVSSGPKRTRLQFVRKGNDGRPLWFNEDFETNWLRGFIKRRTPPRPH